METIKVLIILHKVSNSRCMGNPYDMACGDKRRVTRGPHKCKAFRSGGQLAFASAQRTVVLEAPIQAEPTCASVRTQKQQVLMRSGRGTSTATEGGIPTGDDVLVLSNVSDFPSGSQQFGSPRVGFPVIFASSSWGPEGRRRSPEVTVPCCHISQA